MSVKRDFSKDWNRLASCVLRAMRTYGPVSLSLDSDKQTLPEPDKEFQCPNPLLKCLESSPCGHPEQPTVLKCNLPLSQVKKKSWDREGAERLFGEEIPGCRWGGCCTTSSSWLPSPTWPLCARNQASQALHPCECTWSKSYNQAHLSHFTNEENWLPRNKWPRPWTYSSWEAESELEAKCKTKPWLF